MSTPETLVKAPARTAASQPAVPDTYVDRPRITGAILATAPGGCCLVAATGGYGATTALRAALAAGTDPAVWVGVEAGDSDEDVVARIIRALPSQQAALDAPVVLGAESLTAALRGAGRRWLVVDGLHGRLAGVWEQLAAALGAAPQIRLALITSEQPPAEWEVLAAARSSVRIGTDDLAFTADEAVLLLSNWHDGIDVGVLGTVVDSAEGWAGALAMAGAHARLGRLDASWFVNAGADQLMRPRLARLPARLRKLLLETAVLELLTGRAAEAVTRDSGAGEALLELAERFGFIVEVPAPGQHEGRWWRRHRMLDAALSQYTRSDRTDRHSLAADWFASQGDVALTMRHLVEAGRGSEARDFLLGHQREMFNAGRAEDVLALYELLPGQWGSRMQNMLILGWGQLLSGRQDEARFTLAALEAALLGAPQGAAVELPPGDPDLPSLEMLAAQIDVLRARLAANSADPRTMVEASARATAVFRQYPVRDASQLSRVEMLRGLIWSGGFAEAAAVAEETQHEPFPNEMLREGLLLPVRATAVAIEGRVRAAAAMVARCRNWYAHAAIDPADQPTMVVVLAEALVACETGDLPRALEMSEQAIQRAGAADNFGDLVGGLHMRARCRLAAGDLALAAQDLDRAHDIILEQCPGSWFLRSHAMARATYYLSAGDVVRCERAIASLPQSESRDILWASAALGPQPAAAVRLLESLTPAGPRNACHRHLLLATAKSRSSRRLGQRHLRSAAAIAQEHGIALLLVETSPLLLPLAQETAVEFADDALTWALRQRENYLSKVPRAAGEGSEAPSERLSRGELQLIAILPTRAGNAEVAAMLGISVNTVKTRLRRLYGKLGVSSRDEAIARAEQRGLLAPRG